MSAEGKMTIKSKTVSDMLDGWWVEKHLNLLGSETVPSKAQVHELISRVEEVVAKQVIAWSVGAGENIEDADAKQVYQDYLSTLTNQDNGRRG